MKQDQVTNDAVEANGKSHVAAALTACHQPSIHLIRVPDIDTRKRAFHVLIATQESWVRLPGNVMGVSTRQVDALTREHIPFAWLSKSPSNA
jgi:hypothetical protein